MRIVFDLGRPPAEIARVELPSCATVVEKESGNGQRVYLSSNMKVEVGKRSSCGGRE